MNREQFAKIFESSSCPLTRQYPAGRSPERFVERVRGALKAERLVERVRETLKAKYGCGIVISHGADQVMIYQKGNLQKHIVLDWPFTVEEFWLAAEQLAG